jgi:hypothetical protein
MGRFLDLLCLSTCRNIHSSYNVDVLEGKRNDWSYTWNFWCICSTVPRVWEWNVVDSVSEPEGLESPISYVWMVSPAVRHGQLAWLSHLRCRPYQVLRGLRSFRNSRRTIDSVLRNFIFGVFRRNSSLKSLKVSLTVPVVGNVHR